MYRNKSENKTKQLIWFVVLNIVFRSFVVNSGKIISLRQLAMSTVGMSRGDEISLMTGKKITN